MKNHARDSTLSRDAQSFTQKRRELIVYISSRLVPEPHAESAVPLEREPLNTDTQTVGASVFCPVVCVMFTCDPSLRNTKRKVDSVETLPPTTALKQRKQRYRRFRQFDPRSQKFQLKRELCQESCLPLPSWRTETQKETHWLEWCCVHAQVYHDDSHSHT